MPTRGAMPVPTIADVNGDGTLEIVVSLKNAEDNVESVRVYTVPGSATNCLLWPTGRGSVPERLGTFCNELRLTEGTALDTPCPPMAHDAESESFASLLAGSAAPSVQRPAWGKSST